MKKSVIIILAAAACLMAASCSKDPVSSQQNQAAEKVSVSFNISADTKATGTVPTTGTYQSENEQKVNTLQILVFSAGALDGYATVSNATSVNVECTSGSRTVYAVVNGPDLSSIATETALKAVKASLSTSASSFVMCGSKTQSVVKDGSYSIPVTRMASKIVIRNIKNGITNVALKTLPFVVKRVYITNVAGKFNIGGIGSYPTGATYATASDTWYNKGGYQASNNLGTLTNDVTLNSTVANGSKYSTCHYFYCYPNAYAQAGYSATWAPKRTMLVVQIKIGDNLYDYPIDLLASVGDATEKLSFGPNKMYVLDELTITKLGNPDDGHEGGSDEEDPVTSSTVTFSVTVNDWSVVPVANVTI